MVFLLSFPHGRKTGSRVENIRSLEEIIFHWDVARIGARRTGGLGTLLTSTLNQGRHQCYSVTLFEVILDAPLFCLFFFFGVCALLHFPLSPCSNYLLCLFSIFSSALSRSHLWERIRSHGYWGVALAEALRGWSALSWRDAISGAVRRRGYGVLKPRRVKHLDFPGSWSEEKKLLLYCRKAKKKNAIRLVK